MRDVFQPWVYMLASRRHGTLYIGVTSNLLVRIVQHREGLIPGFTKAYGVRLLVCSSGTRCTTRWRPPSSVRSG